MSEKPSRRLISQPELLDYLGGITSMTLWRWRQDAGMQFPQPITVRRRNFYDAREIDAWLERVRERAA